MYSQYENLPQLERKRIEREIVQEIADGSHNPLPGLVRQIRTRENDNKRKTITTGATVGALASIVLGTTLSLPGSLASLIFGCTSTAFILPAVLRNKRANKDLDLCILAPYLTSDEWDDLEDFQNKFQPQTDEARKAHEDIKRLCDGVFEDDAETVEVEAKESDENPSATNTEPDSDEPRVTEPSPWEKITTSPKTGMHKVTLSQDKWLDKIDKAVDDAASQKIGEQQGKITNLEMRLMDFESQILSNRGQVTNEDLEELRHVQGEQMSAVNQRIEQFEKTVITALEAIANSNAETSEFRGSAETAETLGIPAVSASEFSPETDLEFSPETVVHHEKSTVVVGDFDAEGKEKADEFGTFMSLVLVEGYKPNGLPIIERMWKVQPGGSRRYKAAVERRDLFVSKLGKQKLYGE